MRSFLKAMACMILGFVCIGLGFAQAGSGAPTPSPDAAAGRYLPAPVACDATKGSCWKPTIGMDWQWQLSCDTAKTCTNLDVKVPFYVIDAVGILLPRWPRFTSGGSMRTATWILARGRKRAPTRPNSPRAFWSKRYVGWPHERWLDIRQLGILAPIMIARMQVCVEKGFDGVEFDNVQDWDNPTGIAITQGGSAYYTAWMANQAHTMGLSASLGERADECCGARSRIWRL